MTDFVICYDIADPDRLIRIHRLLKSKALALQYSVFLFSGSNRQLDQLLQELVVLMNEKEDDLRAYPLPKRGIRFRLGKPLLPEGIQWGGLVGLP